MVCLARQVGTQGTSDGHRLNKRRASTEQALGIDWTSVGHRLNKRWAFIAHAVCIECPKVWKFLGTPYRSAALLLCIMPHDDFVILRWRFYDTSIRFMILPWYFLWDNSKCIILLSYYMSVIYLYVQQRKWYFDTFFIKKLFTYEHMLNGKSKKYQTELSHIRKLKELRELRS